MRVEYCVEPTVEVYIDPACEIPDKMRIDDADVYFEISDDKLLKKVNVVYAGLPIQLIEGGGADRKGILINQSYPEFNKRAFKVLLFVFNYIHTQSGRPALDITTLKNIYPTVFPETKDETVDWSKYIKSVISTFRFVSGSIGTVSFDNLEKQFKNAKAYANFADAKNAQNPITKYESLYKVVESFFNGTGVGFDQNVSNFMIKFDSNFVPKHFEELRQLRNRCVHSKDKNHVTSGDVELLEEVSGKTEKLERIAELLLKHK